MASIRNQLVKGPESYTIPNLLSTLLANTKTHKKTCSMSVNPYDTAGVSMIAKPRLDDGSQEWLFPEAYHFLITKQTRDGSWSSETSDLDAVLSTMAALLAFLNHQQTPHITGCEAVLDITVRIARAVMWLEKKLQTFDIESCADNVGFEMLLPSLLRYLQMYGVVLTAPHLTKVCHVRGEEAGTIQQVG
jgi:hypothetical protein